MTPKNFYPEVPEIAAAKTSIDMSLVVIFAKSLVAKYGIEVVRMAYCIFRNESANGKSGVNNNYIGLQGDNAKWNGLTGVIATSVRVDGFGDTRRFICFTKEDGYKISFDYLCQKVSERGMFIGGMTHKFSKIDIKTPDNLAMAYQLEWVGLSVKVASTKVEELNSFKSLYKSSLIAIS